VVPIVTLTTDFGTADSYVAQMKGVLCVHGPETLRIVDLSHEIAPQAVQAAALFVREAIPRFPPGTIHVVVVDPGVGTGRRALVVEVLGQLLVGADNGLFSLLFDGSERVFTIDPSRLATNHVSSTFHGRDVFAPAAAALARGSAPSSLGEPLADPVKIALREPRHTRDTVCGHVIHIDRFGNLVTNVSRSSLEQLALAGELDTLRVAVESHAGLPLRQRYADVALGALVALFGSSDLLEVAARNGNAAAMTRARVGADVVIRRELTLATRSSAPPPRSSAPPVGTRPSDPDGQTAKHAKQ
jgi:S-adenosylmethionine hydrolase